MSQISIPEKVLKYETFLNDVLKVQLKKLEGQRSAVAEEIADYRRLQATTATFRASTDPIKTRVDIGCNFLMNAVLSQKERTILVAIGYGFFVELTLDEADVYAEKRIGLLREKDKEIAKKAIEVKADMRIVLEGLRELQNLPVVAGTRRVADF